MRKGLSASLALRVVFFFAAQFLVSNKSFAQPQTIGSPGDGVSLSGVVLDNGSPIISSINSLTGELKVSERISGYWQTTTLATGYGADSFVATKGFLQNVHVVALNNSSGTVTEYVRGASGWSAGAVIYSGAEGRPAIEVRGSQLLLSFSDRAGKNLILGTRTTSWRFQTIDSSLDEVGGESSIAVSSSNLIAIAYYNRTQKNLKVALSTDNASWSIETVTYPGSFFGSNPNASWSSDGTLHIIAGDTLQQATVGGQGIFHAQKQGGGTWILERVGFPIYAAVSGKIISSDLLSAVALSRQQGVSSIVAASRELNGLWGGQNILYSSVESYSDLLNLRAGSAENLTFVRFSSAMGVGIKVLSGSFLAPAPSPTQNPLSTATPGPTATLTTAPTPSATPTPLTTLTPVPMVTSTPMPSPTAGPTVAVSSGCSQIVSRDGYKGYAQVQGIGSDHTTLGLMLSTKSGTALGSVHFTLRVGSYRSAEIKSPINIYTDGSGRLCAVDSREADARSVLNAQAIVSGILGSQDIVYEQLQGVLPKIGLSSDSTVALVNVNSQPVSGNLTILDKSGSVKNIYRLTLGSGETRIISGSSLQLPASGVVEWKPDSNLLKVYLTLEERLSRIEGAVVHMTKFVRTDGTPTPENAAQSRKQSGLKLQLAYQASSSLVIKAVIGGDPELIF